MSYKTYTSEFKAKVVIEVFQGEKSLSEIAAQYNVCVKCLLARLFPTKCEWTRCSCRDQGLHIGTAKLTAGLRCLKGCLLNQKLLPEPRSIVRHSSRNQVPAAAAKEGVWQ